MVNSNSIQYRINGLTINGEWQTDPEIVKQEVFDLFSAKFSESMPVRPKFVSSLFKSLSQEESNNLELPFMIDEIKEAIWSCGGEKAPGPDGFTFKFLKNYWEVIKEDVIKMVRYFEKKRIIFEGLQLVVHFSFSESE